MGACLPCRAFAPRSGPRGSINREVPPMKSMLRMLTLSLLAAVVLGAPAGAATKHPASAGKRAAGAPLTDANIAAIVLAANTIDIENGELALKQASDDTVKSFAHMMITDHTSVNDKAKALAGKLKLAPKPNAASRGL